MYNTSATAISNDINSRANAYLANEILDASPQRLLLRIYDFAIAQCKNKNLEKILQKYQLVLNNYTSFVKIK